LARAGEQGEARPAAGLDVANLGRRIAKTLDARVKVETGAIARKKGRIVTELTARLFLRNYDMWCLTTP
jgi:hypothetical protein